MEEVRLKNIYSDYDLRTAITSIIGNINLDVYNLKELKIEIRKIDYDEIGNLADRRFIIKVDKQENEIKINN